jgi:hypothetical protein
MARKAASEGALFQASDDDAVEASLEPTNGHSDMPDPPPFVAPPPMPRTPSARARQDTRIEDEKDKNADELAAAIAQWAIPGKKYSFDLMRLRPASYKDEATGRTFNPGRDDGKGMFLQHYDEAPTLAEIEDVHGGIDYVIVGKGPDKDNPDRITSKRFKFSILGPPKTLGMPTGAIPFAHVPGGPTPTAPGADAVTAVTQNMMSMVTTMLENSRKDQQTMFAAIQARPTAPAVDQATLDRLADERAEKQRAHELAMKRADMEAADRRRQEDKALADAKEAREEARAERQRQHDKEMAAMKATEESRREDAKERRAENERMTALFQSGLKEQSLALSKVIEKMDSKTSKDDPEERILRTIELIEKLKGDKEAPPDEGGPFTKAIANALPEVLKTADKFLNRYTENPAPKKPARPATMLIDTAPAPATATAVAQEAPKVEVVTEPEPAFEWPDDNTQPTDMGRMFGKNVELALQAKWGHKDIFDKVLMRFPETFHAMLRAFTLEQVLSAVEGNAPAEALLRTNSGKLTLRLLYKALVKKAGA